jgi:hypothetical protein
MTPTQQAAKQRAARHRLAVAGQIERRSPPDVWGRDRECNIETAIDTLSLADRTIIEIELHQRERELHTFDYDPFARA